MSNLYVMNASVRIGNSLVLNHVSDIEIEQSIKSLSDTARVILPRNVGELNGKSTLLDNINIGDSIEIFLGYNKELFSEFKGYITSISQTAPIELECECEMYKLKKLNLKSKHYIKTNLVEIIKENLGMYPLSYDFNFELKNFRIEKDRATGFKLLEHLKQNFPVDFYFTNKKGFLKPILNFGWHYSYSSNQIKNYHLEENVAKNDLKFIRKEASPIYVTAHCKLKTGKALTVHYGEVDGTKINLNFDYIDNKEDLLEVAKAQYKQRKNIEFEGKITGFGYPRTQAGMTIKVDSNLRKECKGSYLVDSVRINFNENGYRRENSVSERLTPTK